MNIRDNKVDILKGILTIEMVFTHSLGFLSGSNNPLLNNIVSLSRLVSFSGFLFCFGFACWFAYISKDQMPWKNVIFTALKCYLAFALSGIAYRYFVLSQEPELMLIVKILILRDIPGYSEFLIAFSLVTLLSCVFSRCIKFLIVSIRRVGLFSLIILVLAEILPNTFTYDPLLGLFIGGAGFAYFPVILYLPIFIIGAWLAHSGYRYNVLVFAMSIIIMVTFYVLTLIKFPISRFPPNAIWIISSTALVYIYLGVATVITNKFPRWIKLYINSVGQNVTFYLLLSNLVIFICYSLGFQHSFTAIETIGFYFLLMASIYYLQWINIDLPRANKAIKPDS